MLKASGLAKRYGSQWALRPLDLEISSGDIQCLLGANGAGKTTTIHLFLGFLEPTAGTAWVNGNDVTRHTQTTRANLAYVPEQVNLYPMLTGLENLTYFTKLAGRDSHDESRLRHHLERAGLDRGAADMRVEHYSKGMRQKVGLAIALAKGARALLLDEPLSGLDPKAANEFCALTRALAGDGAAVLMVTHDLFRAREIANRIGIMKAGSLVENIVAASVSHSQLERIYLDHMRDEGSEASDSR